MPRDAVKGKFGRKLEAGRRKLKDEIPGMQRDALKLK